MNYFKELAEELETYLEPEQIKACEQAYIFANKAHAEQVRLTGEPYICHPVAAALLLARMRLDYQTIMATLMHDVLEDTKTTKKQLSELFGAEVASLVDGVTKLTQIHFESKAEAQAENFRKMVMAMVEDIRVILVKLADRYHNMATLGPMSIPKKRRIAIETLEIYAPIANRLGMHGMYIGLEDLGFQALYPMRYRAIKTAVEKARFNRKELIQKIHSVLANSLKILEIEPHHIYGRQKHLYSIYRKMLSKKASFSEVNDVLAFRIVTNSIDTCYRVLGVLHQIYKPLPHRFKDYIAIPKSNGYQSLHTALFGPYGVPIEIQIRTADMDKVAENGVAAHWLYKSAGHIVNEAQLRAREWVQRLLDMQKNTGSSLEFIETVKIDLFPDEVYVFTPKGHILELPKGSTVIDFAYAVHSDLGNQCVAAKINRRLVPLSAIIKNGQTIEIITTSGAHPNSAWLGFVITGKAKSNIRHYLKVQQHEQAISLGNRMLTQAFMEFNANINDILPDKMQLLLTELNLKNIDELFYAIGKGHQMVMVIANKLLDRLVYQDENLKPTTPLAIKGTEGMVVRFADCCQPIPGDDIVGCFQKGRGITVHIRDCKMLHKEKNNYNEMLPLAWDNDVKGEYWIEIKIEVLNERGALATLAGEIAKAYSNIGDVKLDPHDGTHNIIIFSISVKDKQHLNKILAKIRKLKTVTRIFRNFNGFTQEL